MKASMLIAALAVFLSTSLWSPALRSRGQDSAQKAREVLDQAITALGGEAFVHLKTEKAGGRVFAFRREDIAGFTTVVEYIEYPNKKRNEYGKKQEEVEIYNGSKGWMIDRRGIRPISLMQDYLERESMSAFHILRYRLGERGVTLEYAGGDILDNHEVDRVNFIDKENRTATMAIDRSTHLPAQVIWERRDAKTGERIEDIEMLSKYSTSDGITAPRHLLRTRNGKKIFESFIQDVQYNIELSDLLFIPPISLR